MFSGRIAKQILYTGVAMGLLTSCGFMQRNHEQEPSHSWQADKEYYNRGSKEAGLATVAYSQGDFAAAEQHLINALSENPRQPQALLVGALLYEQMGRTNRARQYYEDLIVLNGPETSLLGTQNNIPEKMSEIARKRLRLINVRQSELLIEDQNGTKVFNISETAADKQGKSAMEEALFVKYQNKAADNKAEAQADIKAVEVLFTPQEQNIISRFLILKELAEKDLITKEEFLSRRMTNVGGLLPLTHKPGALGIDNPVPSPDMIIERINVLKEAVESRAITPREFAAERELIIEALLPPTPRQRMKNKAPAKDILTAAKDIRKLEVLYDLNLITSNEKDQEKKAIEKYLGINKKQPAPKATAKPAETKTVTTTVTPAPAQKVSEVIETKVEINEQPAAQTAVENSAPQPLIPDVSSPF